MRVKIRDASGNKLLSTPDVIWFAVETAVEAIVHSVKPSRFIDYAERKLNRPLTHEEREAVEKTRLETSGKRDSVKAMRAALEACSTAHFDLWTRLIPEMGVGTNYCRPPHQQDGDRE